MVTERHDADEHLRTEYLKLHGVLHDRNAALPSYPVLFDELRRALDVRRHVGVIHASATHLELIESLYGWQTFDRAVARVADALRALPGTELPKTALLAVGSVPADRFVVFIREDAEGRDVSADALAAMAASVRAHLVEALEDEPFASLAPRPQARVGHALLSESPFFRFERRVHAAVEEARAVPELRDARREEAWREQLTSVIRESRVRTLWQPVVDIVSGAVHGFEALARGPVDSFFESPRAMFALSGRAGNSADLDRLCRDTALRDGAFAPGSRKLFVNALPESLADTAAWSEAALAVLAATGRKPGDVVVEVSERILGETAGSHEEACRALRALGFGLALDDVGTGRDGADALDRLRPDYVKVDPSVIRGIDASLIRQEIFATIVGLGTAIDAAVVAVGVESAAEASTLEALGARFAQGYHFAQPAPRERWVS